MLGMLCAVLFFAYKTDTCNMGPGCHETIKRVGDSPAAPTCDVGATLEVLNNNYIACRCPKETQK